MGSRLDFGPGWEITLPSDPGYNKLKRKRKGGEFGKTAKGVERQSKRVKGFHGSKRRRSFDDTI